jgi:hypothetical protein
VFPFPPLTPLSGRCAAFSVTALLPAALGLSFAAPGAEEQQPLSPTITFAPDEQTVTFRYDKADPPGRDFGYSTHTSALYDTLAVLDAFQVKAAHLFRLTGTCPGATILRTGDAWSALRERRGGCVPVQSSRPWPASHRAW